MERNLDELLFSLEERFWRAGGEFYRGNLADEALMVFPDPAGVMIKDEIVSTVAGAAPRWTEVALEEHRVMQLGDDAALVSYKATARRAGELTAYVARANSAYVRDGRSWKMAFHQQTPLVASAQAAH